MELIFEIVFEFIVQGSLDAVQDQKVPVIVRILSALILLTVYGGLTALFLCLGIRNKSILLIIIAIGMLAFFAFGFLKISKKHKR